MSRGQMAESVLDKLKKRDHQVQQELRARLSPRVLAICTHMLEDRIIAEEVAEDIWMDFIYEHVDKVQKENALGAYLRMMTIRRCVRMRQWRQRHQDASNHPDLCSGSEAVMVDRVDLNRKTERLMHCLQKLSKRVRVILRLRYYNDLTQESIGNALGITKQYIGRVIAKSLEKLRDCMEESA